MKYRVLDNEPLDFYDHDGNLVARVVPSGINIYIYPENASGAIVLGQGEPGNVELGDLTSPVDLTFMDGGILSSNGATLDIGSNGDTINLNVSGVTYLFPTSLMRVSDYTAADVFAKVLSLDGTGSTLDADLLDGHHWSEITTMSGYSGYTGYSGISGYSGFSGKSGYTGYSGFSGKSGYTGYSGISGYTGYSGLSGYSGYSGSGLSGYTGYSGASGISGYSGYSGISGFSGFSGKSGYTGFSGTSGYSGFSGPSGYSGYTGISGYSGYSGSGLSGYSGSGLSGYTGYSGASGISGYTGYSGVSGYSGFSGQSGYTGFSGLSGYTGYSGVSGYSGYSGSGVSGYSGYSGSGLSGYTGFSGISGYTGFSGISGYTGYSGLSGYSGFSGISGYSGKSGYSGFSGSGISGYSGYSGSGISGYSGYSGKSGYTGYSGVSGYSGYTGISGYSGFTGVSGYSGYSGKSGYSGYSGTSGFSGASGDLSLYVPYTGATTNVDLGDNDLTIGFSNSLITHTIESIQSTNTDIALISGLIALSAEGSTSFVIRHNDGLNPPTEFSTTGGFVFDVDKGVDFDAYRPNSIGLLWEGSLSGRYYGAPTWSFAKLLANEAVDGTTTAGLWMYDTSGTPTSFLSAVSGYHSYIETGRPPITVVSTTLVENFNADLLDGHDWDEISTMSGYSGYTGYSGISGYSGFSGKSGYTGYSGISGYSGYTGISGYSGYTGISGYSGFSGKSGYTGYSGTSGWSGYTGYSGISGYTGYSGISGYSGFSGKSGYTGYSGISGYTGYSGISGYSGFSGISGWSGYTGYSGLSGYTGYSGKSGYTGYSGTSGYSGAQGTSGYSGYAGDLSLYVPYTGATGDVDLGYHDLYVDKDIIVDEDILTDSLMNKAGTHQIAAFVGSDLLFLGSTNTRTFIYGDYPGGRAGLALVSTEQMDIDVDGGTNFICRSAGEHFGYVAWRAYDVASSGDIWTQYAEFRCNPSGALTNIGLTLMNGASIYDSDDIGASGIVYTDNLYSYDSLTQVLSHEPVTGIITLGRPYPNPYIAIEPSGSINIQNFITGTGGAYTGLNLSMTGKVRWDADGGTEYIVNSGGDGIAWWAESSVGMTTTVRSKNRAIAGAGAENYIGQAFYESGGSITSIIDSETGISTTKVITSTLASGSAPFAVTSPTVNPNLNADLLDGHHWAEISTMSGYSGYTGYSGISGYSGFSGKSGYTGYSGLSGYTGYSGISGYSGYTGASGTSGYSGFSGKSGYTGYSGTSGYTGYSGISGYSGYTGASGISGYTGYSGISGYSGFSGKSGYTGYSGISGYSGYTGLSGYSGYTGISGYSGYTGTSGYSGYSGKSGYSGAGTSGYSGYSGAGDLSTAVLLAGRAGGQTVYGGTGSGDDMVLQSTSNATLGHISLEKAHYHHIERTGPGAVGEYVEIGSVAFANGGGAIEVMILNNQSGLSYSKSYRIHTVYNGTGSDWQPVVAMGRSEAWGYFDWNLEAKTTNGTTYLRITITNEANTYPFYIWVTTYDPAGSAVFAPSSGTGTATTSADFFDSGLELGNIKSYAMNTNGGWRTLTSTAGDYIQLCELQAANNAQYGLLHLSFTSGGVVVGGTYPLNMSWGSDSGEVTVLPIWSTGGLQGTCAVTIEQNGTSMYVRVISTGSSGDLRWAVQWMGQDPNYRCYNTTTTSGSGKSVPTTFAKCSPIYTGNGLVGINTSTPGKTLDITGDARVSNQLISTVATGTAPLAVTSTTAVTNLNSDQLDGHHWSELVTSLSSKWYTGGLASAASTLTFYFSNQDFDNLGATYISKTSSTSNGDSFTINKSGIYSIVWNYSTSTSGTAWIDRNASATTGLASMDRTQLLAWKGDAYASYYEGSLVYTGYLAANDVIRVKHSNVDATVQSSAMWSIEFTVLNTL